jgi:hypothetical protein
MKKTWLIGSVVLITGFLLGVAPAQKISYTGCGIVKLPSWNNWQLNSGAHGIEVVTGRRRYTRHQGHCFRKKTWWNMPTCCDEPEEKVTLHHVAGTFGGDRPQVRSRGFHYRATAESRAGGQGKGLGRLGGPSMRRSSTTIVTKNAVH